MASGSGWRGNGGSRVGSNAKERRKQLAKEAASLSAFKSKNPDVQILTSVPTGWQLVQNAITAPLGYKWYTNGESRFSGKRKSAIVRSR